MLPNLLSEENKRTIEEDIGSEGRILFCSDYDGTLTSFTQDPRDTETPDQVIDLLEELSREGRIDAAVLSGRELSELTELMPIDGVSLAGSHGIEVRYEDGEEDRWEGAAEMKFEVKRIRERLENNFSLNGGIMVEDKGYSITFHYRKFEGDTEELEEEFFDLVEKDLPGGLEILDGSKVYEIKPEGRNKGHALELFKERHDPEVTFYLGDDETDEDAFVTLDGDKTGYPTLVSEGIKEKTNAEYALSGREEVEEFMGYLVSTVE